ncbi:unnamed protein product [Prorocentrum cordatum]|uniref:Ion transport domain-containing protein n=1 Tax=Prorocentrum cordatum TaxID=2364126 RepID=A0ABN9R612_9DINO|nr:unnamed protein product [Polarella glacialis]
MLKYQSMGATPNLFPFHGAEELRTRLYRVRRNSFDYSMAAIIVMSAIYLGNQTAWVLHSVLEHGHIDNGQRWFWLAGDIAFALVLLVELTLRIFAYQVKFFTGSQRWWNAFDCFTMSAAIAAVLLDLFRVPDSFGVDLLKVVRLARIARSLRASNSKIFHALKTLSYTVAGSANAFLSAIFLLAVVIFVFCVMFMQGLQSWVLRNDGSDADTRAGLVEFFGSGTTAFLTLLACVTGGVNWMDVSNALLSMGPFHAWFFVLFIVFTVLCVLNILNGVFVNVAIVSAQTNKELAVDRAYDRADGAVVRRGGQGPLAHRVVAGAAESACRGYRACVPAS